MNTRTSVRAAGFFLITLIPVMTLHLVKLFTLGEAFDGLISSLAFTLPFLLALMLVERLFPQGEQQNANWVALAEGAILAVGMWSVIALFWNLVPESFIAQFDQYAFYSHLICAFLTGLLAGTISMRRRTIWQYGN